MIDPEEIAEWKRDAERDVIPGCDAPMIVLSLLAEREELLSLLREVEWADNSGDEYDPECPVCGGRQPGALKYGGRIGEGHAPDCRLDAFLWGSR